MVSDDEETISLDVSASVACLYSAGDIAIAMSTCGSK